MGSYRIELRSSVEKDMRALPRAAITRVLERLESLADEPFPAGVRKLTGTERLYRIRVGDYRVLYEVDHSAGVVTIHYVRHRRDAYRSL